MCHQFTQQTNEFNGALNAIFLLDVTDPGLDDPNRPNGFAQRQRALEGTLPVGSQATPMSYVSARSGRQHVVLTAGGARLSPDRGDYVIAYALP
jgi:hypothetical protein